MYFESELLESEHGQALWQKISSEVVYKELASLMRVLADYVQFPSKTLSGRILDPIPKDKKTAKKTKTKS